MDRWDNVKVLLCTYHCMSPEKRVVDRNVWNDLIKCLSSTSKEKSSSA